MTPINPARFQVLDVDDRIDIRTFVQNNSLIFKAGQGFYEFTKPEKISDKKEVVLVDKVHVYAYSYKYRLHHEVEVSSGSVDVYITCYMHVKINV